MARKRDGYVTHTEFKVYGPFAIPLQGRGPNASVVVDDFWRTSRQLRELRSKRGCYVFGVQSGKARKPHYVGLTKGQFDHEVFNPSNLKKYVRAVGTAKLRKAFLYLIVHPSSGRTATRETRRAINEAEDFLIQAASAANPSVQNVKGVPRPKWLIRGVTKRVGKPSVAARQFRKVMGFRDKAR